MQPIILLMTEHRLIEQFIAAMENELAKMREFKKVDLGVIEIAVDFMRTYADRTHHGKEEGILFRDLKKKSEFSPTHEKVVNELIDEHTWARETIAILVQAKVRYSKGEAYAINDVVDNLQKLVDFYPRHIDKEDNHFFYPSMDYFSKQEQNMMLEEFREFDRQLIHEKYHKVIDVLKRKYEPSRQYERV